MFDTPFDVRTAMDLMSSSPFQAFPSIIRELSLSRGAVGSHAPTCDVQNAIRNLLLSEDIPRHVFKEVQIDDAGAVRMEAPSFFAVTVSPMVDASDLLTLPQAGKQGDEKEAAAAAAPKIHWRVLDVTFMQMEQLTQSEKEEMRSFLEVSRATDMGEMLTRIVGEPRCVM